MDQSSLYQKSLQWVIHFWVISLKKKKRIYETPGNFKLSKDNVKYEERIVWLSRNQSDRLILIHVVESSSTKRRGSKVGLDLAKKEMAGIIGRGP